MRVDYGVIKAICVRDLRLYFSNPTGYVFITLFIFLSAAAAFWQESFFLSNLANLDQLNRLFPYLLLVFAPAITMGVWADEKRQGTDELLLTLPATDLEIALGKYLSALGIYTAALVLSLSHVIVLFWLGNPDIGLMISNYLGYFLIGAAFIATGMLASLLSPSATIAYILGAILCSLFVYLGGIVGVLGESAESAVGGMTVYEYFGDFASGVVSLSGLLYFVSVVATMLYLAVTLLGRRHWPREADGYRMWVHVAVRSVALIVAVIAFNALVDRTSVRLDLTAERLHSLSNETRQIIKALPDNRPVLLQAFISPEVPEPYVQTRSNLFGFLREIDAMGGDRVQVLVHDTEPFSEEARDAREKFGILPRQIAGVGARAQVTDVFLGVAVTSGAEEDVIEFFDRGLPTEYEITRSIRVVSGTTRKKVGVLNTQAQLFGGFDFNTFQSRPSWPVVDELKKQYDVVQISATDSIAEDLDGLLVALPSSLPQEEMDVLLGYIQAGNPTMLLVDPLPVVNIGLSPSEQSGANVNPFMRNQGPPPKPKGNIGAFMNVLGIAWNSSQVIWDAYNPHPSLASLPPEIVFIGEGNQNPESFNRQFEASAGLQELVLLFPGTITAARGSAYTFEPIVRSGTVAGSVDYSELVQRTFFGTQLVTRNRPRYNSGVDYVFGAHVRSSPEPADTTSPSAGVNIVVISDLDFISDQFFEIRRRGIEGLNFDNITLFLNCMDMLVGDDSFIALRNRRVKHRTLRSVEARTREFTVKRAEEERQAESEAQVALSQAQQRLDEKVAEVRQRSDLDDQAKQIMTRNLQEVENRKLEALRTVIEAERDAKIQGSQESTEQQIRRIQSNIKTFAGLLPPIPIFAMGIVIFLRRRKREREGAAAVRRLRN
jgi:ABC-2 type transport system permease protein